MGYITQIIGPVLDVASSPGKYAQHIQCIIQQLLGSNEVRLQQLLGNNPIAMSATDGLIRVMGAVDTGSPLSIPEDQNTLDRISNVLGEPVDNLGPMAQVNVMAPLS
ncbi:hypothetical protein KP509_25G016900 [Ceratopteris richardii]|uniref:H(+)-transporting two-sector ATPase n=2 Tax=Ceratopteris richardii TaxID=49495 RepID=A0A8T2RP67_CERRI|nr:hypothetical protein KP509_25G016900 [Ceratopteris richardii]